MRVIGRYLLVLQDESESEIGGIYVPKEKVNSGVVRLAGDKVSDINVGDKVYFSRYGNTLGSVEHEGEKCIVLHESSVEIISKTNK